MIAVIAGRTAPAAVTPSGAAPQGAAPHAAARELRHELVSSDLSRLRRRPSDFGVRRETRRRSLYTGPGSCRFRSFGLSTSANVEPGWPGCPPGLRPLLRRNDFGAGFG